MQISMLISTNEFQGLKYNPKTGLWSEVDAGFLKPFHSACVVNIDDPETGETLFLTGGTGDKIEYVSIILEYEVPDIQFRRGMYQDETQLLC